ncbi:MAG: hypothetical protein ABIK48_01530 [candidate division WOR-3 bacterium]
MNALAKDEFVKHAGYYLLLGLKFFANKKGLDLNLDNTGKIFKNYKDVKKVLRDIVKQRISRFQENLVDLFKSDDLVEELRCKIYQI